MLIVSSFKQGSQVNKFSLVSTAVALSFFFSGCSESSDANDSAAQDSVPAPTKTPPMQGNTPNLSFVPNVKLDQADPVWLIEMIIDEISALQASDVYVSKRGTQGCISAGQMTFTGDYFSLDTSRPPNGTNNVTAVYNGCNNTPSSIAAIGSAEIYGSIEYDESWSGLMYNDFGLVTEVSQLATNYSGKLEYNRYIGDFKLQSGIHLLAYSSSYNGQTSVLSFDVIVNDVGQVHRVTTTSNILIDGFEANPYAGALNLIGQNNQSHEVSFNRNGVVISGNGNVSMIDWAAFDSQFEDISNRPL